MTTHDYPFLVGVGKRDITPPLEVGLLMSSVEALWAPFQEVRQPLYVRLVVIQSGARRIALASLDLLGLSGAAFGGWESFKNRVVACAAHAVSAADLLLAVTHTHSAPETLALTDLCHTPAFQQWADDLAVGIGTALAQAVANMQPCRMAVGRREVPGLGLYRRIKTVEGIVLSHPEPPPEIVLSREGPVDDSVPVAAFLDTNKLPVALLINAVCHPVYEMCIPRISPDYPGEMSRELEHHYPGAVALFFNGAAGNINPRGVSSGAVAAERHGQILAAAVKETIGDLQLLQGVTLELKRHTLALPARTPQGQPAKDPLLTEIAALQIGEAALVFLPGEVFVETGLAIRENSPFPWTMVVGYAEEFIGYIPTNLAFEEGGYETGPGKWCIVGYGSEQIVRHTSLVLLSELI
jgi:neutral ceramidase